MTRIGLISDTHGLLRPEARAALMGSDRIVHAGDIGDRAILDELASLAPLSAVRGNNDRGGRFSEVPAMLRLKIEDSVVLVLHDVAELETTGVPEGTRVVVSGHSHKPSVRERDGVLFVNPGSAGPRRFLLPVTIAHLTISGRDATARIVDLPVAAPRHDLRRAPANRRRAVRQ